MREYRSSKKKKNNFPVVVLLFFNFPKKHYESGLRGTVNNRGVIYKRNADYMAYAYYLEIYFCTQGE